MRLVAWPLSLCLLALCAAPAAAHERTAQECVEAGEFIEHAAVSREAGMAREAFLDQVRADLVSIRSVAPELRWFVQDVHDEALLLAAVEQVFDEPVDPVEHGHRFRARCFAATPASGADAAPAGRSDP